MGRKKQDSAEALLAHAREIRRRARAAREKSRALREQGRRLVQDLERIEARLAASRPKPTEWPVDDRVAAIRSALPELSEKIAEALEHGAGLAERHARREESLGHSAEAAKELRTARRAHANARHIRAIGNRYPPGPPRRRASPAGE